MKEKRAPGNTTNHVRKNPMGFLAGAIIMGGNEAILHQEAQGQRSFIGSDSLPTDIGRHSDYDEKVILEAAGVKFLGVVDGDDMFQYVELPQGWKKVATDHSMWSKLVDDKDRERAQIFYKAAFYDRRAFMSLSCRYHVAFDHDRFDKESVGVANVTDGDKVIYTTDPIPGNGERSYEMSEKAKGIAIKWLNQNYPDWQNPGAYWD